MATGKASKKTKKQTGRKLSRLSAAGDEASRAARRALLLTTCEMVSWDLSAAAKALELADMLPSTGRLLHEVFTLLYAAERKHEPKSVQKR